MNSGDLCFVCWNVSPENECTSNTARAEIKQAPLPLLRKGTPEDQKATGPFSERYRRPFSVFSTVRSQGTFWLGSG